MEEEDQAEALQKKRIEFFKTALNIYRGRSWSLNAANESQSAASVLPLARFDYETLQKQVDDLHNAIAIIKCLQDSIHLMRSGIKLEGLDHQNSALKREVLETSKGIAHFSKNLIKMYKTPTNGVLQRILNSKMYWDKLKNHQNQQKESEYVLEADERRRLKKAEGQVGKINIMRSIIAFLSGKFCTDPSHAELKKFLNPCRRNLTVEDFRETWDVGRPVPQ